MTEVFCKVGEFDITIDTFLAQHTDHEFRGFIEVEDGYILYFDRI